MKTDFSGIEHIGHRLRVARREKELTQGQLAARVGTNRADLQKIENGKSLRPGNIMDLAEALDVNPAWRQFGELPGRGAGGVRE